MRHAPSILLVREWEAQMSGSGCCGRLEGDFLQCEGESFLPERRNVMESMGPLYRALKSRLGDSAEIEVVDPRNFGLFLLLLRDFWRYRVGLRAALSTLAGIPVQAVVVNGRIVARGAWPDADAVLAAAGAQGVAVPTS